jgi:hypothetical protein
MSPVRIPSPAPCLPLQTLGLISRRHPNWVSSSASWGRACPGSGLVGRDLPVLTGTALSGRIGGQPPDSKQTDGINLPVGLLLRAWPAPASPGDCDAGAGEMPHQTNVRGANSKNQSTPTICARRRMSDRPRCLGDAPSAPRAICYNFPCSPSGSNSAGRVSASQVRASWCPGSPRGVPSISTQLYAVARGPWRMRADCGSDPGHGPEKAQPTGEHSRTT